MRERRALLTEHVPLLRGIPIVESYFLVGEAQMQGSLRERRALLTEYVPLLRVITIAERCFFMSKAVCKC